MAPKHMAPAQWTTAQGVARAVCAKVFREGGSPVDALRLNGVSVEADPAEMSWSQAVDLLANAVAQTASAPRALAA
ncbi:MAG: hypothetical protein AAFR23_01425 [Pseudomonadota bacterium]